jgi:hypothetical protein
MNKHHKLLSSGTNFVIFIIIEFLVLQVHRYISQSINNISTQSMSSSIYMFFMMNYCFYCGGLCSCIATDFEFVLFFFVVD